jgi:hypothetical protein
MTLINQEKITSWGVRPVFQASRLVRAAAK